jgi:hypothetical protein
MSDLVQQLRNVVLPLPHYRGYEFDRAQEEAAVKAKAEREARDEREQRRREANGGLVDGVTYG